MLGAPEALALYPVGQTSGQFVTNFYTSVFGRLPDARGLAFWSASLDALGGAGNAAARVALIVQISTTASTPLTSKPGGISDAAYIQAVADRARFINKIEFGVYFADELKSNDVALATDNPSIVGSAKLGALATGIAKVDAVNNVSLDLNLVADDVSVTLLDKVVTGTRASMTGASTLEIAKVMDKISSFAVGDLSGAVTRRLAGRLSDHQRQERRLRWERHDHQSVRAGNHRLAVPGRRLQKHVHFRLTVRFTESGNHSRSGVTYVFTATPETNLGQPNTAKYRHR